MRKIALADGDGAGQMRDDRHRVRRRDQPVAEKERRRPADDDGKHVGRKGAGELARHQHLGVGEFPDQFPGRRDDTPLSVGLRLQAIEIARLAVKIARISSKVNGRGPCFASPKKRTPRALEHRLQTRAAARPPPARNARAQDRSRRRSAPSEKASSRWVVKSEKAVKTSRPRTSARTRVTRPTIAPTEPLDAVSTSAGTTHCSAMPRRLAPKAAAATAPA